MLSVALSSAQTALRRRSGTAAAAVLCVLGVLAGGCASSATASKLSGSPGSTRAGVIDAIGAENQYADVLTQIGGPYVRVSSILSNPNTDPHTFESSPSVAREVSSAQLIVQNGVGYDDFMNKMEAASPSSGRQVIVVQRVLGLPSDTPNPHLWYDPTTMPAVAKVIASDMSALQPAHASVFDANEVKFVASLTPWLHAIAAFKARYGGAAVATTEPVADYLLTAMGIDNLTPFSFQADVMNGVDPSPQDIALEDGFFSKHEVKVFCYNQQVVDDLTSSFEHAARKNHVPIVGLYETMPTPGFDYQSWMLAEVQAIQNAIASGTSTEHL